MSYKPTLNKFSVNNTKSNLNDESRHRATQRNVQVGASREYDDDESRHRATQRNAQVGASRTHDEDEYRHRATQRNSQVGASRNDDNGDEELYMYKAKKYHNKCHTKLLDMKKNAERTNPGQPWTCPSGFSKYLSPFQV